ncbi:response regulator [Salaquimonas pukyongi]|uniref:response regulator n=1 Tax=Salaquimonas pukyongi TaxID=2712698 RepID=UPI00096BA81D|nr:response regulator [Salaquimonas pukyongi]
MNGAETRKLRFGYLIAGLLTLGAVTLFTAALLLFNSAATGISQASKEFSYLERKTFNLVTVARRERAVSSATMFERTAKSLSIEVGAIKRETEKLDAAMEEISKVNSLSEWIISLTGQLGMLEIPASASLQAFNRAYSSALAAAELFADEVDYVIEAQGPADMQGRIAGLLELYENNTAAFYNSLNAAFAQRATLQHQVLTRVAWVFVSVFLLLNAAVILLIFRPLERTIESTMRALRRERRRAESADRAKSEFLANMSHEIRTPMNGVMGMAELLVKTELSAKQKTYAGIIMKSGASLLTIINDILDFSKLEARQMELDAVPFNLAEAMEDVTALFVSRAVEKDLELIVRIDPDLPKMLVGDAGRLRQIVTNLMGNAVKFTEQGHIFLNIRGEAVCPSRGDGEDGGPASRYRLTFEVEDTGIGIPPEKCAAVFEKFSQVDGSATRRHEGTGLGLSIAASLAELMGGKIGLQSEPGKGSTFWFTVELPAHEGKESAKDIPVNAAGAKILVVDDNAVNRSILSEQMAAWQFDAAACVSGEEALAVLREAACRGLAVDCVVMDYHMPGMNGGDVVRAMKGEDLLCDIPVVMLTSVEQTEDGKAFSSLGISAQLVKPARSSQLLEAIQQALRDARGRAEGEEGMLSGIAMARKMATVGTASPSEDVCEARETVLGEMQHSEPQHEEPQHGEPQHEEPLQDRAPSKATASRSDKPTLEPEQQRTASGTNSGKAKAASETAGVAENGEAPLDILVCEDNEVNQIVFTQILDCTGYSYKIAKDGKEGVAFYSKYRPHLILMDVSMPRMNGLEATGAIRKLEQGTGGHTPVIGVTAHAIKGDMERCLKAGMDDYLAKPVSPDRLCEKIDRWMPQAADKGETQAARAMTAV